MAGLGLLDDDNDLHWGVRLERAVEDMKGGGEHNFEQVNMQTDVGGHQPRGDLTYSARCA